MFNNRVIKRVCGIYQRSSYKSKLAFFSLTFYILLLVPLIYIARYNVPSVDDYEAFCVLKNAVATSSNPLEWIGALWRHMLQAYFEMQGVFSAYFFGPLLPLSLYRGGAVFLLFAFSFGVYFLLKEVLCDCLQMPKCEVVILFVIVATTCIQFLPSPVQGFYWWSGAFLYTGFFSLGMLTIAYFIWLLKNTPPKKKLWHYFAVFLLMFIVGGSNFPTALTLWVVVAFLLLYVLLNKKKSLGIALDGFISSLAGLVCNVLAPGNMVRMEREGVLYQGTISKTLDISFRLGFQFFRTYFTVFVVLTLCLAAPILYVGLKDTSRKFRWPLLFSFCTFCTFCALFAPTAYSYGWIGPDRYMNIVYFGFVLLVFANETYYIGWLCSKLNEVTANQKSARSIIESALMKCLKRETIWILVAITAFSWVITRQNFYVDSVTTYLDPCTTISAIQSLQTGQARNYYGQYCARRILLEDPSINELKLTPYPGELRPTLLYFDDITVDVDDWRNRLLCAYYEKDSICIEESN